MSYTKFSLHQYGLFEGYYPGNIDEVTFFLHDSINPIAGRLEEARKYFKPPLDNERMRKPIQIRTEVVF